MMDRLYEKGMEIYSMPDKKLAKDYIYWVVLGVAIAILLFTSL